MSERNDGKESRESTRERGHRRGLLAGITGAALLTALILGGAIADARAASSPQDGHGFHGGRHGHALALEGALRWIGADESQRSAVREIAAGAHRELEPIHEEHRARVEAMAEALLGDAVDREALERLRQEEVALADRASQRIVEALADAAEQLDAAQRAELLEMARLAH